MRSLKSTGTVRSSRAGTPRSDDTFSGAVDPSRHDGDLSASQRRGLANLPAKAVNWHNRKPQPALGRTSGRASGWWLAFATAGALGWAEAQAIWIDVGIDGPAVGVVEPATVERPTDEHGPSEAAVTSPRSATADAQEWVARARFGDEAVAFTADEAGRWAAATGYAHSTRVQLAQSSRAGGAIDAVTGGVDGRSGGGIGWGSVAPEPLSTTPPPEAATVSVTIELPPRYQGVTVSWSGVPLDARARRAGSEAWAPAQNQPAPIVAELAPGEWLLQARGTGDDAGLRFAVRARVPSEPARVMLQVAPAGFDGSVAAARDLPPSIAAPERVLDRSRVAQADANDGHGPDEGYFCPTLSWTRAPCPFVDEGAALGFVLPQGFNADWPMFYTTAAGVRAEQPTLDVYRSVEDEAQGVRRGDAVAVLNPRQWLASNGPCIPTRVGPLCVWLTADKQPFDADRQALIDALVATLRRFPDDTDFDAQGQTLLNRLLSDASD